MRALRPLLFVIGSLPCFAATFGTVVQHPNPLVDLAIDEARKRLYVVDTTANAVEVYNIAVNPPRLTNTISTPATPLSIALSPGTGTTLAAYLYVACYDGSALDIVDLNSATFASVAKGLDAKPQAVAVGYNGQVLISTIGTGTGGEVLIVYDPTTGNTRGVTVGVTAPVAPTLPAPNGVEYYASKSHLQASADGTKIVGVNLQAAARTVFVFDVVSSTVLASRVVPVISSVLAVAPDGKTFLSGPILFDSATMAVLAQQNVVNSPYVFPASANFNTQTSQGGAVFTPDGGRLLVVYNIVPVTAPASPPNSGQLTVNAPDTLLIQMGINLQQQLSGKIAITSDGSTAYAISQSGFTVFAIGTLQSQPIAVPDSRVALLASDQCGVTSALNSATIPVRDSGGGKITVTAQVLTNSATSPSVRTAATSYGGDVTVSFSGTQARSLGTATPDQLLIQSSQAINIVPNVRVFQNARNPEAQGTIVPMDWGATSTGLADMLADTARQRIYIANPGLNRLDVFDMQKRSFLTPIAVGQLPASLAMGGDGNTLYVASGGGEHIDIVDLNAGAMTGRVLFPPLPFGSNFAVITPAHLAVSERGIQAIMSDGSLWKVVGNEVTPRTLNPDVFGTLKTLPAPQSMTSSPEGLWVLILAGNGTAYLYSSAVDDFVVAKSVIPAPITGYFGPIAAGLNGQYYLVNGLVFDSALTPNPLSSGVSRPVAAMTALGATSFAQFSIPVTAPNATPSDPGIVSVIDVSTLRTTVSATALEGPATIARSGARANVLGRSMAVDAAGGTAFVLTASGISVISLAAQGGTAPALRSNAVVNSANGQAAIAPGGLIAIQGTNLATAATAGGGPLPTLLGGTCVTLNNSPLPLLASSPTQISAQLPPALVAGRYPVVVHSIGAGAASSSVSVTVSKYAPAVFVNNQGEALLYHANGDLVDKDHPGTRDEHLTLYATGMGATTGGAVTAGVPSPASPMAVTGPVNLYFGNPKISDAGVIVDWSGLVPGQIGVYQINCRIPGTHLSGDALPITVKIGGVSSPTTGSNVPFVWVH